MTPAGESSRERSRSPHRKGSVDGATELLDGHSAKDIFEGPASRSGYTYDDIICMPGQIDFSVHDVALESNFTRGIRLKIPIVSSPMDTVTESKMAIGMALQGGIGVIHTNMPIEEQAGEVMKVKKYKQGFIMDPICLSPETTLGELVVIRKRCGFTGFPVTTDGKMGSKLVGLVTKRETDFVDAPETPVSGIMTRVENLLTAAEGVELKTANAILQESKKGKLPIVTKVGNLAALIARTDLKKNMEFPLATKSKDKSLMVAASVGTRLSDRDRVRALVGAGVDAIVVDSSQGDSHFQHEIVRWMKKEFPSLQVIGGNVVTKLP